MFRSVAAKKYRSLENLHVDENGEQVAPLDELSDIAKDPFNENVVTSDASSFELETGKWFALAQRDMFLKFYYIVLKTYQY